MSYILIAQESLTLPFVVRIDGESVEQVLSKAAEMEEGRNMLQFTFIIDLETQEVKRVSRSSDGGWLATDTALDSDLGVNTKDEYFEDPQTAEMTANDC